MSLSAEELFEEQCAESLARVRVIGAVSQALDELAGTRVEQHWRTRGEWDEARGEHEHERDVTGFF